MPSINDYKMIEDLIIYSLERLKNESWDMVENAPNEMSINGEFMGFIRNRLEAKYSQLNFHINNEYDLHGILHKNGEVDGESVGRFRPDILIHRRGINKYNLLAIEAKKGYPNIKDKRVIHALLHKPKLKQMEYMYSYGCFISYNNLRYCIVTKNNFYWMDKLSYKKI